MSLGGGATKCSACDGKVYKLEELQIDKLILHKTCFKCTHCKCQLTLSNYAAEIFHSSGGKYSAFGGDNFQHQETGAIKQSEKPPSHTKSSELEPEPVKDNSEKRISLKEKLQSYEKAAGSSTSSTLKHRSSSGSTASSQSSTAKVPSHIGAKENESVTTSRSISTSVGSLPDSAPIASREASTSVSSLPEGVESLAISSSSDSALKIAELEKLNKQLKEKVSDLEEQLSAQQSKTKAAAALCKNLSEEIDQLKKTLE